MVTIAYEDGKDKVLRNVGI